MRCTGNVGAEIARVNETAPDCMASAEDLLLAECVTRLLGLAQNGVERLFNREQKKNRKSKAIE
jgi:hypothetical protein